MKKIFVAYADDKMAYALKRIGRQAKKTSFFDEIRLFTPKMLPEKFRKIELMQYSYGGGYWAWKPYIIWKTLQENEEGTVVCYADAGCTLRKHQDWKILAEKMETTDTILFQYPDEMKIWEKFGTSSTQIKYWTKKESILFYDELTGSTDWRETNKIWGGCIWVKGKNNIILENWLKIIYEHPEIIRDWRPEDEQFEFFAQHKHDQSLLTALAFKFPDARTILPAKAETNGSDNAIEATRIRVRTLKDYIVYLIKEELRTVLGQGTFNKIKKLVKGQSKQNN